MIKLRNLFRRKKYAYFITYYSNNHNNFGNVHVLLTWKWDTNSGDYVSKLIQDTYGHKNVMLNSVVYAGREYELND